MAYPTETLYGLGVDATNDVAVRRLYEVKGLPEDRGVSVLLSSFKAAEGLIVPTDLGARLAGALLPGPLTLIFDAGPDAPEQVLSVEGTIGVRVSPHLIAQELCTVGPVTATSANVHDAPAAQTAQQVREAFGERVDVVLDGGLCGGPGSTVVDARGARPVVLREGQIPTARIERVALPDRPDPPE